MNLLESCNETKAVIDHFGFFRQDSAANEETWAKLLALSEYPQVIQAYSSMKVCATGGGYT